MCTEYTLLPAPQSSPSLLVSFLGGRSKTIRRNDSAYFIPLPSAFFLFHCRINVSISFSLRPSIWEACCIRALMEVSIDSVTLTQRSGSGCPIIHTSAILCGSSPSRINSGNVRWSRAVGNAAESAASPAARWSGCPTPRPPSRLRSGYGHRSTSGRYRRIYLAMSRRSSRVG